MFTRNKFWEDKAGKNSPRGTTNAVGFHVPLNESSVGVTLQQVTTVDERIPYWGEFGSMHLSPWRIRRCLSWRIEFGCCKCPAYLRTPKQCWTLTSMLHWAMWNRSRRLLLCHLTGRQGSCSLKSNGMTTNSAFHVWSWMRWWSALTLITGTPSVIDQGQTTVHYVDMRQLRVDLGENMNLLLLNICK